jgi:CRP/FNR family cyclic AMP-dependent transcriptional regulator
MAGESGAEDKARLWPQGTLLDVLKPADLAAFSARGSRQVFSPGETLIIEGDSTKDVFLLLNGWVKVIGNSVDGREVLLSIRTGGDSVGELAALDGQARAASVVAASVVTACVIPQGHFLAILGTSTTAALAVARASAAKMRLSTRHRIDVSGAQVLQRLARVLEYMTEAYATPCREGLRIDVVLTRTELAGLVGVAEPSLYRALAYLRARNVLLTRDRHYVVCDLASLEKIAHGNAQEGA